jgi:hypothetical protein
MRGQFARWPIADITSGDVLSSSWRPTIVVAGDDGDDVYFFNSNGTYSVPNGSRLHLGLPSAAGFLLSADLTVEAFTLGSPTASILSVSSPESPVLAHGWAGGFRDGGGAVAPAQRGPSLQ